MSSVHELVYVGSACEACGCWRVRSSAATTALDPICPHCGTDCQELNKQRSEWNSMASGRMWKGESLSKIVRETRDARAQGRS